MPARRQTGWWVTITAPASAYYAAYSKVTFALAAAPNVTFPAGREGPNHPGELGTGGIRRLIETSMPDMEQSHRVWLSELIGRLYTLQSTPITSFAGRR